MKKSFFIKYGNYRTGLRYVVWRLTYGIQFVVHHNDVRNPADEVFDKGFVSLLALQFRLKQLYPEQARGYREHYTEGEIIFYHLFQDLFLLSERYKRKYLKKKKK